jgi:transcription initiation factor TFIID TATA-box-binding protein
LPHELTVVNLIATANLNQTLPLQSLANVKGFLYDETIYGCAYLKDKKTKAKVAIFRTGKMISVGTKRFKEAKHDLDYAARKLLELGVIRPPKIVAKTQNIVATSELGQPVAIEKLARKLPNVIYEPEQFPGAFYYAKELDGASVLIFANGKIVLAGLKDQGSLDTAGRVLAGLAEVVNEND